MTTRDENELLTRTGPGTPMGGLLRQYWVPALLPEELPEPDGPPIRLQLLGEQLVAFRDSHGRIGLLDKHCAHRGASLFFGRNAEGGLRCVYHGWKYDVAGRCVDMPNEPEPLTGDEDSPAAQAEATRAAGAPRPFKEGIQLKAYPVCEWGGIVWTYMGPARPPPALPALEWTLVPDAHRYVAKRVQECNYLQALEGGVDLSHIAFLHRTLDPGRDREDQKLTRRDVRPTFEVVETDCGLMIAARRHADAGRSYWRISQFIMPWYTMFPPLIDEGAGGHAWVPIDDERCWAFSITWDPDKPPSVVGEGIYGELIPGTYRPRANRDNDYLVDRAAQRTVSFTGIPGFAAQDCAVQESMGAIVDRSRERLGPSDLPILALRRRLRAAANAFLAGGEVPGLDPRSQHVRPAAVVLPREIPVAVGAKDALSADPGTSR
ncbi:MAG: Rieske 2Fe-2S domain-containing protein [Chloroflexi bacterium]|nr:Rieske 2Fe-2S domain-containing protein [Chloroflexota bacterium]